MKCAKALVVTGVVAGILAVGCGDNPEQSDGRTGGKGAPAAGAAAAAEQKKEREPLVLKDEDFVESTRNRDPFHSYTTLFRAKAPDEMQRHVIMPTTAVEEMRLIAIVSGMPRPKAMLVDPMGVGYVVERGDYLGRPKMIQATGSVSMTLNWRVDRIRENEVVLTQQDPADPTRAALTKIIPLRDEVAQK
jgi:type IV pilus assembly protein PilP